MFSLIFVQIPEMKFGSALIHFNLLPKQINIAAAALLTHTVFPFEQLIGLRLFCNEMNQLYVWLVALDVCRKFIQFSEPGA